MTFKPTLKTFLLTIAGILLFLAALMGLLKLLNSLSGVRSTILTSTQCAPPCWYGIRPNQTSLDGVRSVIYDQNWVDSSSIDEITRKDQVVRMQWLFQRPAGDFSGTIHFEDERVKAVTIVTTGALTLEQAFDLLGEPELMWTHVGTGENREYLEIVLLYPSAGDVVEVDLDLSDRDDRAQVDLKRSAPVFRITYFDPADYPALLDTQILIRSITPVSPTDLRPWTGLGSIEFER